MTDTDYIGVDKLEHGLLCCIISVFSTQAAIGAALGKEFGDKRAYGNHWCWWDILADTIGVLLGTAIRILIICIFNWPWWMAII